MKILKWLGLGLLAFALLAVVLVALAPTLFGGQIRAAVDEQLARYVDADVAYGDVDLSLLRNFPKLTFSVEDVVVEGVGEFEGTRLAAVDELAVAVDFWSAIGGGPVAVRRVSVDEPFLQVVVRADGRTNTDIVRVVGEASDTAAADGGTDVALESYAVTGGTVIYADQQANTQLVLRGLDHSGSGDFTASTFALDTETDIATAFASVDGVAYLDSARVHADLELLVDTDAGTVTLADNALRVNDLTVTADGVVGLPAENGDISAKVDFAAPEQSFAALWSAIPATFARELDGIEASGAFTLSGMVDGVYEAESGHLPAFAADLTVTDGAVQYPDLPKAIRQINVQAGARSAGRDLADLLVDVQRFAFSVGESPFSGSLRIRQGTTDPAFDLTAKGRLNLGDVAEAIPLEGVNRLAGTVAMDVKASGRASAAEANLRSVATDGVVELSDIAYEADGLPAIAVPRGAARFSGTEATVEDMAIRAGASDMVFAATLSDPLAVATETGTVTGSVSLTGKLLDANEWIVGESTGAADDPTAGEDVAVARPFDRFDIGFSAAFDRLLYDVYELTDARATGKVSSETLVLEELAFGLEGSQFAMDGRMDNLYDYAFADEILTGDLTLSADQVDALALSELGADPNAAVPAGGTEAPAEYIALPERMNLRIATSIDKVLYDGLELDRLRGDIAVADQSAVISNGRAGVIGGTMSLDGAYAYRGPDTEPTFDMQYDLQNASFREAFEQINTVQQLAPVAQYMTGNFSTDLTMKSTLTREMLPNLAELDADGFLQTINATLQSFGPLETVSEKLGIKELDRLDFKNSKNWFTIDDGTVTIQPVELDWGGIDASVAGTHGLDQSMDYLITALIPRDKLGGNVAGAAVNKGLDFLGGQASKLGLDLDVGKFVRVGINLTGSIDDPSVGIKLLGTEGEGGGSTSAGASAAALAKQAKDSLQRVAQAKLDAAKDEAKAKAQAAADQAKAEATRRATEAADAAKAKAREEAKRVADEATRKASEEAKAAAKKAADQAGDDVKDKAKDALKNVFGKKKPD